MNKLTFIIISTLLFVSPVYSIFQEKEVPGNSLVEYTDDELNEFIENHNLNGLSSEDLLKILKDNSLLGLKLELLDKIFREQNFDGFQFKEGLAGPKEDPLETLYSENHTIE